MLDGIKNHIQRFNERSQICKSPSGYGWIFRPNEGEEVTWYNPTLHTNTHTYGCPRKWRIGLYSYYAETKLLGGVTC